MKFILALFLFTLAIARAQVEVIVHDVGAAHSALIKLPNNKFIIFDAGSQHNNKGKIAFEKIKAEIPEGGEIEAMIISHSDADHLYAANDILDYYKVKVVLHTGYAKTKHVNNPRSTYNSMIKALKRSYTEKQTKVFNLNELNRNIIPDDSFTIGETTFDFLCGFKEPKAEWKLGSHESEKLNSVSIVMKMTYKGSSVLFTGDAVGRYKRDTVIALMATEKYLVEKRGDELDVDVVIAPHHGADNGSSAAFCAATSPKYVIFPCGKSYNHPVKQVYDRYRKYGKTKKKNFFRTDRGEGWISSREEFKKYKNASRHDLYEWAGQSKKDCEDPLGDDDVSIKISAQGKLSVKYVMANNCK